MSKKSLQVSLQEQEWEDEGGELILGSSFTQGEERKVIVQEATRDLPSTTVLNLGQTFAEVLAENWDIIQFSPELNGNGVIYEDRQTIAHALVLNGNGAENTILRGADAHAKFFAQGNQLIVQNLTWEGDLYAGANDIDTEGTHLELRNVCFSGNLFGSSCEENWPFTHNGNVELVLSNSTFTAGSCIFGSAAVLDRTVQYDVDNHIVIDADCTGELAKFYGGGLVVNTGILNTENISIEVHGGTWGQFFGGARQGDEINGGNYTANDCVVTVTDGVFRNWLATGSQSRNGTAEQNNATLNIIGGTFNNVTTGGVSIGGNVRILGNATLNISGGTFGGYVFGGSGANNLKNSAKSIISGTASINIDASENTIRFEKNIYGGSFGKGRTMKGSVITFSGKGENLSFAEDVVISGSNQSAADGSRAVFKMRELRFQEFTGTLSCNIGRSFTAVVLNDSSVEFGGSALVDTIPAWNLELLSNTPELIFGTRTVNDFTGDSLTVFWEENLLPIEETWQLISAVKSSQLRGWDAFASVTLGGETATFSDDAWRSTSYMLTKQGNSLCVCRRN